MYQDKNGFWRSDFRFDGKRYQKSWDTKRQGEAKLLERKFKEGLKEHKIPVVARQLDWLLGEGESTQQQEPMKLSEALEWMDDRVWQHAQDAKNPPSRMNTIIRILGDRDICSITDEDLQTLKHKLLIEGVDGKTYAGKTFNHFMSVLKTTIDMLESHKVRKFPNKPSFKGLYTSDKVSRIVCFTDKELEDMLDFFKVRAEQSKKLKDQEMLEYLIINSSLGLRPAEFYALEVGDIDFKGQCITISKAIKTHNSRLSIGGTKNGLVRTLPIGGRALETLHNMVERIRIAKEISRQEAAKLYLDESKGDKKELYYWIIQRQYDRLSGIDLEKCPLTGLNQKYCEGAWKAMQRALGFDKRANAKDYTMYALRHTVASRLVSLRKFSAHKLMMFLGHTNIQTSLKYVHLNVDDIREGCGVGIQ
ncbi:tyrosine-type recombinase/integrase [Campylobacter curvus]|uniref:tyrosine-type recombinase/integrase n=1 Tax=Campylobacter curvus TaxID=200 RepID=UPI00147013B9